MNNNMKSVNFGLQMLLIILFVILSLFVGSSNQTDLSIYFLWLLFTGIIQGIGTLYKNAKYKLKHQGYLYHLVISLIYLGLMLYLQYYQYFSSSFYGEMVIMYYWLPVPFALACFYTYNAYQEIDKKRKTMLDV
jgi:hypothetical protein